MKFEVISLFPQHFESYLETGVIGQAVQKELVSVRITNPRQFTSDVHQSVDDRPFGGGDGMVMTPEPLAKAIEDCLARVQTPQLRKIYLSPQGVLWNQSMAKSAALSGEDIVLLSGRYGGIDHRLMDLYDLEEISIGDYVLSGGELPALILIDSIARFIPGVLGNQSSSHQDSLSDGFLEAPQFTRPRDFQGVTVPEFLLSGDHAKIEQFRQSISMVRTSQKRPDLIKDWSLVETAKILLKDLDKTDKQTLGVLDE